MSLVDDDYTSATIVDAAKEDLEDLPPKQLKETEVPTVEPRIQFTTIKDFHPGKMGGGIDTASYWCYYDKKSIRCCHLATCTETGNHNQWLA
jgi:hypothetical protein